jgi:hypothetical protein
MNPLWKKVKTLITSFKHPSKSNRTTLTGTGPVQVRKLKHIEEPTLALPLRFNVVPFQLIQPTPAFLSVIPADKFEIWMNELERVMTYYLFADPSERPTRTFHRLAFRDFDGVAYTHDYQGGKETVLSNSYMQKIASNRSTAYRELSGVVIHEMTHAFQNNGGNMAPLGLIEGSQLLNYNLLIKAFA